MKSISQTNIFDYMEIEILGDLERLKLCLENIEDDELCKILEEKRGLGRNDFPVRVMLNLIYAMKIFGHRSVESFRRELLRNSQLRKVCGLKDEDYLYLGKRKTFIPKARVFTNFFKSLIKCQKTLDFMFDDDVKFMYDNLKDFGEDCALDGKLLDSYAKTDNKKSTDDEKKKIIEEITKQHGLARPITLQMVLKKVRGIMDMKVIFYVMQIMGYQYGIKKRRQVYQNKQLQMT